MSTGDVVYTMSTWNNLPGWYDKPPYTITPPINPFPTVPMVHWDTVYYDSPSPIPSPMPAPAHFDASGLLEAIQQEKSKQRRIEIAKFLATLPYTPRSLFRTYMKDLTDSGAKAALIDSLIEADLEELADLVRDGWVP